MALTIASKLAIWEALLLFAIGLLILLLSIFEVDLFG